MVVGATWYSPVLFGKPWTALMGGDKKLKELAGNENRGYMVTMVGALVLNFLLAALIGTLNVTGVADALWLGLLLWVGFVAIPSMSHVVFSGQSWKLWVINESYYLVVLIVNSLLFVLWP